MVVLDRGRDPGRVLPGLDVGLLGLDRSVDPPDLLDELLHLFVLLHLGSPEGPAVTLEDPPYSLQ